EVTRHILRWRSLRNRRPHWPVFEAEKPRNPNSRTGAAVAAGARSAGAGLRRQCALPPGARCLGRRAHPRRTLAARIQPERGPIRSSCCCGGIAIIYTSCEAYSRAKHGENSPEILASFAVAALVRQS